MASPRTNAHKHLKSNIKHNYLLKNKLNSSKDELSSSDPYFNQTKNFVKKESAHKDLI